MMLYLIPPHWTFSQFDLLTNRTFLDPFYRIFSHALPLLLPNDMAFKVLSIPKCPTIDLWYFTEKISNLSLNSLFSRLSFTSSSSSTYPPISLRILSERFVRWNHLWTYMSLRFRITSLYNPANSSESIRCDIWSCAGCVLSDTWIPIGWFSISSVSRPSNQPNINFLWSVRTINSFPNK